MSFKNLVSLNSLSPTLSTSKFGGSSATTKTSRNEDGGTFVTKRKKIVILGEASVGKSSLILRYVKGEFSQLVESTIGAAFFTKIVRVPPLMDECKAANGSGLIGETANNVFSTASLMQFEDAENTRKYEDVGELIRFDIWDTAGQERFATLAPMYYRNAAAAIVAFDVSSQSSFERAKLWVEQLKFSANNNLLVVLVANKCDLLLHSANYIALTSSIPTSFRPSKEGSSQMNEFSKNFVDLAEAEKFSVENSLMFFKVSAKIGHNVNTVFESIAKKLLERDTESNCGNGNLIDKNKIIQLSSNSIGNKPSIGGSSVFRNARCCS